MSFLSNLKEQVPSGERLYSLLALIVIIAIAVGYVLFARFSILPQLQARNELSLQLAAAEQQLVQAQRSQEESPEGLDEQLAEAQAALEKAASIFLSEAEAAEVLKRLYQYADESDVEIVSLQERGTGEPEVAAEAEGEGTGEGEGEAEAEAEAEGEVEIEVEVEREDAKKDTYDVRVFQLQVEGTPSNLIAFVSQIEEAAYKGFAITNVNIAEGEERPVLTMDITLYTSPYSSGAAGQVTPVTTPVPTLANLTPLEESLAAAWASEDWEQAIVIINEILALDPNYDDGVERLYTAYVNYGCRLLGEGDNDAAIMQFNLALAVKPDGEEALAGLQQSIVIPTPTLTAEEQLAKRLDEEWEAENWEEVISLIEQVLATSPDDEEMTEKLYAAHVNYGYAFVTEGRLEEAKEEFSLALVIKPGGVEATAGLQQLAGGAPPPAPPPSPPPESEYIIHVVQPGDNLFRIALRYNTTVQVIMAANGLTDYNIHVGQQLRIPTP